MEQEADDSKRVTPRGLIERYCSWLDLEQPIQAEFIETAMVAVDANVLLSLYEIGATARREVLRALRSVRDRLWVADQVAVEFSRNRKSAVLSRDSRFRDARREIKRAPQDAIGALLSAVEQVQNLRTRNRSPRQWDAALIGLDEKGLKEKLDGLLDPLLSELDALGKEHDLSPKDVQAEDSLLREIDDLLKGAIGPALSVERYRSLVREAIDFRFPNSIPPGYLDATKDPPTRAAGDYLLWSELLDETVRRPSLRNALLITNDIKADWWKVDRKSRPLEARPELVHEMFNYSGCAFRMLTMEGFLVGASRFLNVKVSEETVEQIREVAAESGRERVAEFRVEIRASSLSHTELENLVRQLFLKMGYQSIVSRVSGADEGFDVIVQDASPVMGGSAIIIVKRYRTAVGTNVIREAMGALQVTGADQAIVITTGSFSKAALNLATNARVRLVDGAQLKALLVQYLNVDLIVDQDDGESDE